MPEYAANVAAMNEAQMEYTSKPVPVGAKFRNAPLLAAGIGILKVCNLLFTACVGGAKAKPGLSHRRNVCAQDGVDDILDEIG